MLVWEGGGTGNMKCKPLYLEAIFMTIFHKLSGEHDP